MNRSNAMKEIHGIPISLASMGRLYRLMEKLAGFTMTEDGFLLGRNGLPLLLHGKVLVPLDARGKKFRKDEKTNKYIPFHPLINGAILVFQRETCSGLIVQNSSMDEMHTTRVWQTEPEPWMISEVRTPWLYVSMTFAILKGLDKMKDLVGEEDGWFDLAGPGEVASWDSR